MGGKKSKDGISRTSRDGIPRRKSTLEEKNEAQADAGCRKRSVVRWVPKGKRGANGQGTQQRWMEARWGMGSIEAIVCQSEPMEQASGVANRLQVGRQCSLLPNYSVADLAASWHCGIFYRWVTMLH